MILHRETFNNFGYWPKNLKKQSSKKVLIVCPFCEKIRSIRAYQAFLNKRCKNCNKTILTTENRVNIDDKTIVDLIYSSYYCKRDKYRGTGVLSIGRRNCGGSKKLSIFQKLKLNEDCNTKDIKNQSLNYLLNLNTQQLFNALTYILHNYVTPFQYRKGNRWFFSDSSKRLNKIFNKLGFSYKEYKNNTITILNGSFFINGQWIHVG